MYCKYKNNDTYLQFNTSFFCQTVYTNKNLPLSGRVSQMNTLFWKFLVIFFIILAYLGTILPGFPTTVFLILATWAASKGWPEYYEKLINHPKYGKTLKDWRDSGTIPRKIKYIAICMMCVSGMIMCLTPFPLWLKIMSNSIMFLVAIWLWTRPEPAINPQHEQCPALNDEHLCPVAPAQQKEQETTSHKPKQN